MSSIHERLPRSGEEKREIEFEIEFARVGEPFVETAEDMEVEEQSLLTDFEKEFTDIETYRPLEKKHPILCCAWMSRRKRAWVRATLSGIACATVITGGIIFSIKNPEYMRELGD